MLKMTHHSVIFASEIVLKRLKEENKVIRDLNYHSYATRLKEMSNI